MAPIPGLEGVPDEVIQAMLAGAEPPQEPPAAPTFTPPAILTAPRPDYLGRLGLGLAGVQGPQVTAGSSPAQALVSGLLTGGARSLASNAATRKAATDKAVETTNAANKSAADRNYANAVETWKAKLTSYYKTQADRQGKVMVTKKMAADMGVPDAVGTYVDPMDAATQINKRGGMGVADKAVAGVLGVPEGTLMEPGTILGARNYLKPASASQQAGVAGFDPEAVAAGIAEGTLPADPAGYSRGQWGVIAGHLQKKGVDVTKLSLNYRAIRQQVTSMNQSQLLSYRAAILKAAPTMDYTESLVDELERAVPQGMVKEVNRAQLAAIARGAYGAKAANLATQIIGQISGPLNGEMATVYSRGGVPTDEARRAVQRQVSEDMGPSNIRAAFRAMRRDLNYAQTAMDETGAWSPWNPTPGGTPRPFDLGGRLIPGGAPVESTNGAVQKWGRDANGNPVRLN